ncbi:MAG: hypothetical protein JJ909_00880 [Roseivirga sp.]|uniref:hypothetical protein n=1 Tax=Roseivirga sp. TaxID=1964215 RepID=UPI001B247D01|nr:hypothetical protein [Roseivirga sp.]MBO6659622.1 hypothetical protein [Roseivirga sp.]MBO6759516.1 hypothetical protein [Roseivirga sp.]MBO6907641.1 hypothetical protein [Roseivirga sp.]
MKDKTSYKYFSLDDMKSRAKDKSEENYNYKLELWFSVKKELLYKNISLDDIRKGLPRYENTSARVIQRCKRW